MWRIVVLIVLYLLSSQGAAAQEAQLSAAAITLPSNSFRDEEWSETREQVDDGSVVVRAVRVLPATTWVPPPSFNLNLVIENKALPVYTMDDGTVIEILDQGQVGARRPSSILSRMATWFLGS